MRKRFKAVREKEIKRDTMIREKQIGKLIVRSRNPGYDSS